MEPAERVTEAPPPAPRVPFSMSLPFPGFAALTRGYTPPPAPRATPPSRSTLMAMGDRRPAGQRRPFPAHCITCGDRPHDQCASVRFLGTTATAGSLSAPRAGVGPGAPLLAAQDGRFR